MANVILGWLLQKENAVLQAELEHLRQQGGRGAAGAAAAGTDTEPMEEDAEMGGDEASGGGRGGTSKDGRRQAGQQQQQAQQEGRARGMAVAPEGSDTEDDDEAGDVTDNDSQGR